MAWFKTWLLVLAPVLACGARPDLLAAGGEISGHEVDLMELAEETAHDEEAEASEASGRDDSWVFVALPDVAIYVLEYPGMLVGQTAWFATGDHGPRHVFYLADEVQGTDPLQQAWRQVGARIAVRDFQRVCGGQGCRRGDMAEVHAAWAAQRERWAGEVEGEVDDEEGEEPALALAGARPGPADAVARGGGSGW